VAHRARPSHRKEFPVHVTLRARPGLPSLRGKHVFSAVREALRAANRPPAAFRVVHFSVQADHVHLIVEAGDTTTLQRATRGLVIRTARAINRALGRSGPVWGDRYHARALRTPREVRHGLVYVLMNFRKHRPSERQALDPCSSAAWFDGFEPAPPTAGEPAPVAPAPGSDRSAGGATGW
jgi:REP element-mobilizing transposase RayT